jgi:hypothetical protein
MTLHFCDPVFIPSRNEKICYVNYIADDGSMNDCGPPHEWLCHDWVMCFCFNWYIALGLEAARVMGKTKDPEAD